MPRELADESPAAAVRRRYEAAKAKRAVWEAHWRDCYDHVLPHRMSAAAPGAKAADRLFDGTAADAVEQLAASLLAELTPPWSRWFGLAPGPEATPEERALAGEALDAASAVLQAHFDRSNFAMEVHQCYLDLATAGTACLLFEEAAPGAPSAFRFTAVPLETALLEEGPDGALDVPFRRSELTVAQLRARFPDAKLPASAADAPEERRYGVIESVTPEGGAYVWRAVLDDPETTDAALLAEGAFAQSPFINFRWMKAPGETYGRSPVMKALPDIKTANKVVELVLKNASIAVSGIWQAEDDGVLNPATVRLVPGAIIPKAMGSAGLTPLEAPGRFDVSELVLADLRARIRHALLADRLAQVEAPRMTATEVLERAAAMARLLGATYGRLQSELLAPLVERGLAILRRRGEIPDIRIDGRLIALRYRSPLAQAAAQAEARATLTWLGAVAGLGPEALAAVDLPEAARHLGRALGVPAALIREAGDG